MTEQEHRELDVAVAMKVMGWRLLQGRHENGWALWVDGEGNERSAGEWHPSSLIGTAWEVVERLRHEGYTVVMSVYRDGWATCELPGWRSEVGIGMGLKASDRTLPIAICRAALEWAKRRAGK